MAGRERQRERERRRGKRRGSVPREGREEKKREESSDGHILVWETGRVKLPLTETGRLDK